MFTGLVEDVGTVERAERRGDAVSLVIATKALAVDELAVGDSVAVDGCCLTVTERGRGRFSVLAGDETVAKTTLGDLRSGASVNLERALKVGARLGGHMVSGHIDGVGQLQTRRDRGANLELVFRAPAELLRYVVAKGSIAIDGISLTVNSVGATSFGVALIPHTVAATSLANKAPGHRVNLEVDIIGKYVEKLLVGYKT